MPANQNLRKSLACLPAITQHFQPFTVCQINSRPKPHHPIPLPSYQIPDPCLASSLALTALGSKPTATKKPLFFLMQVLSRTCSNLNCQCSIRSGHQLSINYSQASQWELQMACVYMGPKSKQINSTKIVAAINTNKKKEKNQINYFNSHSTRNQIGLNDGVLQ